MLGPTVAVAGMADLLGATMLTSKYVARLLREDGRGLWPEIGQGRRGGIKLRHLVNFLMAYALCGGRLNDGPRVAHEFGLLRMIGDQTSEPVVPPNANALFYPSQFTVTNRPLVAEPDQAPFLLVDHFCGIIKDMIGGLAAGKLGAVYDWPTIRITLGNSAVPMFAEVTWNEPSRTSVSVVDHYLVDLKLLPDLPLTPDQNKLYRTQVIIGYDEFRAFASLASKAEDVDVHTVLFPAPGSVVEDDATPDETKPAGAGTHSGLQSGQPAPKAQTAPLNKAQSATKQKSKQRSCKLVVPRSQVRHPREPERTRRHGTHWSHFASA